MPLLFHSCANSPTRFLHSDRHLNACQCVVLHTKRRWIAKEHDYGVTNVFIDGRAVLQRDFRHFGEVVIEKLGEIFRSHFIGDLSESDQIGKANCKLFALADNFDVLLASEYRVIYLRRQYFASLEESAANASDFSVRSCSRCLSSVISEYTATVPPSSVRRSLTMIQRPLSRRCT